MPILFETLLNESMDFEFEVAQCISPNRCYAWIACLTGVLKSLDSMRLSDLIRATENKYNRLLSILIVIYLAAPFLLDGHIGNVIVFLIFFGAISTVVYQTRRTKRTFRVYAALMSLALLLKELSYSSFTPDQFNHLNHILSNIILIAFLALSVYLILREITLANEVTGDLIKGAICVFFLLGFLWTSLYEIVYSFDPGSFNRVNEIVTRADLTYFSFTTLTTVGYGDISPASQLARVLANLEGIAGIIYPSVLIARLVGLQKVS